LPVWYEYLLSLIPQLNYQSADNFLLTKALCSHLLYQEHIERKKNLYNEIIRKVDKDLIDSLGRTNKKDKELFNKLKEYFNATRENSHEKISFFNFLNRMCFWMATGSGKTIVLVKLIEVIDKLISAGLIPKNDILILTHRDDLISQIEFHVNEFNLYFFKKK
jgi:type I site-specific restriction-modification system R (restriction) subunit